MSQGTGERSAPFEDALVVDADVHLRSGPVNEEAAAYMDHERYRRKLTSPTARGPWPSDPWDREMGKLERRATGSVREQAREIDETLCGEFGIDCPVVNSLSYPSRMSNPEYAAHVAAATNDLLLDRVLDDYDHFRGLGIVAPQAPDRAAEEVDRLGDEDGIVGILVVTSGPSTPLGDPMYDPIYSAAEENGLHVAFHGAAGTMFDYPLQDYREFLSVHVIAHLFQQVQTLVSLLTNGAPVKFPDLNFVMLEAGVGWVPYVMFRYNKEYAFRRSEAPLLEESPEQHVRDSFYFGTQPIGEPDDPEHIRQLLRMVGSDSLVFATDYPHWDFDHPDGVDGHLRDHFDAGERERILADNAAEAFGLDP